MVELISKFNEEFYNSLCVFSVISIIIPIASKKTPISPKLPSDNIKTVMHMHSTSKNAGCFSHAIIYSSIIHGKSINGEKNRSTQPIPNANLWWNILGMCWLNGSREIIINSLEFIRLEALNFNKPLNRFTIFFPFWLYRLKITTFCGCDCHFTYAIQWVIMHMFDFSSGLFSADILQSINNDF